MWTGVSGVISNFTFHKQTNTQTNKRTDTQKNRQVNKQQLLFNNIDYHLKYYPLISTYANLLLLLLRPTALRETNIWKDQILLFYNTLIWDRRNFIERKYFSQHWSLLSCIVENGASLHPIDAVHCSLTLRVHVLSWTILAVGNFLLVWQIAICY